ncbi:MAG: metal-dependent transcriptional regulator [Oscillospiraceae bacterium]
MQLLESGEMYLETIYILSKSQNDIRAIDIVNYTGYSKPSISRAMGILKNELYIEIDKNGFITLTEKGKAVAKSVYSRHLLLTDFLTKIGVSPEVASEDACKIEHHISDETFDKLSRLIKKM